MFLSSPSAPLSLPRSLCWIQRLDFPHKLGLCDRLYGRALARHGTCWVRTAVGPVWKLDLNNATHRWIVYGCYEGPGFWRWLRAQRPAIGTIVDSGANIGQTVLYFASMLPAARIIAYEPGSAARDWLAEGVSANGFPGVTIEALGLGATTGKAFLSTLGSSDRHGAWNQIDAAEGEPIQVATLDTELDRQNIPMLDLWKLDMEGYEIHAVRGAARALAAGRIRAIYAEAGFSGRETAAFLIGHGFSAWAIRADGRLIPWRDTGQWDNALFLAPGHPAQRPYGMV